MARLSAVIKNKKREKLAKKFGPKAALLRKKAIDPKISEDERDTSLYIKTLIRQEQDYRNLLTKEQLKLYLDKLADFELNNQQAHDSYSSLFFSEKLLKEFISKF